MWRIGRRIVIMNNSINTLVINKVNVIDIAKKTIMKNMTITCSDGVIKNIVPTEALPTMDNAEVLELPGRYVLPGLIDAHVHLALSGVDDMGKINFESITKRYLRNSLLTLNSGVTTVRNMPGGFGYSVLKFRDKVNAGKFVGPRILASGPALSPPYGYFSIKGYIPAPPVLRQILSVIFGAHGVSIDVDTPPEVVKTIKKLKRAGVDFIKTTTPGSAFEIAPEIREFYRDKKVDPRLLNASMKPDVFKAIVKHAHDYGLKVAAHTIALPEHFKQGVDIGLDSIEHTPFGFVDMETFDKMAETGVCWVPTALTAINIADFIRNPDSFSRQDVKDAIPEPYHSIGRKVLETKRDAIKSGTDPLWAKLFNEIIPKYEQEYFPVNFENAIKAGVKIVAGTDAGAGGAGWVPHGFLYKELELFVKHGMDEFEALKSATVNSAELLGVPDIVGNTEQGKYADFVILNANPLDDILNIRQVEFVIKEGKIVKL
jgi:imidazolonepropionase-like amidohydrolase